MGDALMAKPDNIVQFPRGVSDERMAAIEAEMCEMRSIITLMHVVVMGEQYARARDHLVRSMEKHHARLDALVFPSA
jgi:hypothetical protein